MRTLVHPLFWLTLVMALAIPARMYGQAILPGDAWPPLNSSPADDHVTLKVYLNVDRLQPGRQAVIAVAVEIAPGFHAQSHEPLNENLIPFTITFASSAPVTFHSPIYPPGIIKNYPALGKLSVYDGRTVVYVPIDVTPDASTGPIALEGKVELQICDENVCFPPQREFIRFETEIVPLSTEVRPAHPEIFTGRRQASGACMRFSSPWPYWRGLSSISFPACCRYCH
jgi:DsbC/DsbD-like thiol-disulfide interchange protein